MAPMLDLAHDTLIGSGGSAEDVVGERRRRVRGGATTAAWIL
jgi:hypothetical protein